MQAPSRCPTARFETPAFMPVGTHGVVRGLSPGDVRRAGAQIILGNTYHLHLRPGEDVVRAMGGLHRFTTWTAPMLTDSGGFQVFSLEGLRRIGEDGVEFQSHVDGTYRTLTPERAVEIQWALGADVAMAFDHVVPGQAPPELAREGMERTLRWLDRCRRRHAEVRANGTTDEGAGLDPPAARPPAYRQTLGPSCRAASTTTCGCARSRARWSGVRGPASPSAGSRWASRSRSCTACSRLLEPALPRDMPRYLMGVGFPADLLEGIARGVDLFDCVAATRNGRHGTAWVTAAGSTSGAPRSGARPSRSIPSATARPAPRIPRGYLRHLFVVGDMLGLRLVSLHNIRFLVRLGEQARAHILAGTFDGWSHAWLRRHSARGA